MKLKVYKLASRGAKRVANQLSILTGKKVLRSRYHGNVTWGNPHGIAANKLATLNAFTAASVPCPFFTTDPSVASEWLHHGRTVLARKFLRGAAGRGIVLLEPPCDLVPAPLYVKYIPKKKEFRVHVFNGKVILVQEKRRRKGTSPDPKVRSHGDWVFCTQIPFIPNGLNEIAIQAVEAVHELFGAVDIIWNEKHNMLYALEVNTAPGVCNSTARIYAQAILEYL